MLRFSTTRAWYRSSLRLPVLIFGLSLLISGTAPAGAGIYISPIPGFTTEWHPAPSETSLPLGTTVQFKLHLRPDHQAHWYGADAIAEDGDWSVATYVLDTPGQTVVRVDHVWPNGSVVEERSVLDVVAISPDQIEISPVTASVEPTILNPADLNASTMENYRRSSIATLRQVGENRYRTSIRRPVTLKVDVSPQGFAPLLEWRHVFRGQPRTRMGERVELTFAQIGTHHIAVGPVATEKRVAIETYSVEITSHISDRDIVPDGVPVTFTARTEPPGFEDEITWLASTKYGLCDPTTGRGMEFTTVFENTWDVSSHPGQWLGTRADNATYEQDQKTLNFSGLAHIPLGEAELSPQGNSLRISNIGQTGNDGVAVTLGETTGFHSVENVFFDIAPVGATMVVDNFGRLDNEENAYLGGMSFEKVDTGIRATPDFSAVGAESYEVQIYSEGQLVFSQGGMSGPALTFPIETRFSACCHKKGNPFRPTITWSQECPFLTLFAVSTGQTVLGDFVQYLPESSSRDVGFISEISLKAKDIPGITLTGEWVELFGIAHRSLGRALFQIADDILTIKKIGTTGEDGLIFDFLDFIVGFDVSVNEFTAEWMEFATVGFGAMLEIESAGQTGMADDQRLGHIRVSEEQSTLVVESDFSESSLSTNRIELYRNGSLVAATSLPSGVVASVTSPNSIWPTGFRAFGGHSIFDDGYSFLWPQPVLLTIPGQEPFTGDELRILAEAEVLTSLQRVNMRAAAIPSISIVDETINGGPPLPQFRGPEELRDPEAR